MLFIKRNRNRILASFFVLLVIVLFVVYAVYPRLMNGVWPEWTGFSEYTDPTDEYYRAKTLWDWLALLIISAILGFGVLWFNEQRAKTEREIATDRQREDALQNYLDKMSELLLDYNLLDKKDSEGDPTLDVAQVRTVTTLRMLDRDRRNILLQFLGDANLASFILRGASLNEADLSGINMSKADLSGANLIKANLSETLLIDVDLSEASLSKANLSEAWLFDADLSAANLNDADLSGSILINANFNGADLSEANLNNASLIEADLSEATVNNEQLAKVKSLMGATMPDGTVHE